MSIFFHNQSGTFVNVSNTSIINTKSINYTPNLTITLSRGNVIGYGFWANDTLGNVNTTTIRTFTIANTPPTCIAGTLNNTSPKTNDVINQSGCSYSDADSEAQATSQYKWYRNNAEISGETGGTLNLATAGNGNRGDTINGSERPFDGTDYGNWVNVTSFAIIANSLPSFSSASITQTAPNTTTTLTGTTSGYSDPDSDGESGSTYKWYKNDAVIGGETTTSLASSNFVRNDVVIFEATPSDGTDSGSPVNSSSVAIVDSPVSFGLSINTTSPKKNEVIQISANATDDDILSMTIFSWNMSGSWLNVSNITLSATANNYSVNQTVTLARGNVVGYVFYSNDSVVSTFTVSSLNTFVVADTTPTFTLANNNTAPKKNEVMQLSALVNDSDTLSMVIASWNGTSGVWQNMSNITLNAPGNNYTINVTVGVVRGNTIGWVFYSNDSVVSTFTASSLNTFTVANTPPTCTAGTLNNTAPKTNDHVNQSGCTYSDADGDPQSTSQSIWFKNNQELTTDFTVKDIEDAVGSDGSWNNVGNAYDENFDTLAFTTGTGNIYINYSVHTPSEIIDEFKIRTDVAGDNLTLFCRLNNTWIFLHNETGKTANLVTINKTILLPDCYWDGKIQLRFGAVASSEIRIYEDKLWIKNVNGTLDLSQPSNGNRTDTINASERPSDGYDYGDWVNISTFATVQDTSPTFITANNNSNPKINDVVQLSALATDADTLSMTIASWNGTSGIWQNVSNITLNAVANNYSVNLSVGIARNHVIGWLFYANDSVVSTFTASSINTFVVANSVPSFTSASITETAPNTTTTLTGTTSGYSDPDSDSESGSTYKWYKNDAVIGGETTTSLASSNFVRNDVVIFEATPSDGTASGSPVNSSSVTIVDTPISFGLAINNSAPKINEVVQISANATDDDILSMTIFSWNMSGSWLNVSNITLSATGNNYSVNLSVTLARANVIGWLFYANDSISAAFTASSLNTFAVANTIPTCIAGTLNNTSPKTNDVINQSGCAYSDADSDAQATSQYKWFKNNIELSGETSGTLDLSQTSNGNKTDSINASERPYDGVDYGSWINVSAFATVLDTIPPISVGINTTLPKINWVVNISFNISGEADGLSSCLIKNNQSGAFVNSTFVLSGTSGFCSAAVTLNVPHAVVNFTGEFNDTGGDVIYQNSTKITIQNTVPTVASATINNSNPTQFDDLKALNGATADDDSDSITLFYNWTKNGIDQAISTQTLDNSLTTAGDIWVAKITPFDGFANGTTQTSASVSIGTGNIASGINATNATPLTAELLKGQWINLSTNFSDTNIGELHTAHFCKTNGANSDGCTGDTWCSSPNNVTGNFTSCRLNITNTTDFPTLAEYSFYTFVVDNTTLISSSSTNTFTIQDITPPIILQANFSVATIVDGNKLNLTINVTDNVSNIDTIKFNLTNPNGVNIQRLNPTFFSVPSTLSFILNYTIFGGSETSVQGVWNLTYLSVNELSGNLNEQYPNKTFTVTAVSSGSVSLGGGGGGAPAPKLQNVTIEVPVERCGNLVCEVCDENSLESCIDESPLSCPQDCKFFSIDESLCFLKEGTFDCGNFRRAWFINGMLFLVVGGLIFTQYRAGQKAKKGKLKGRL